MSSSPVRLNVYDMYWLNEYASTIGFGIFHSGLEVHGVEYAYGGHQFAFSGIFTNEPQNDEELGENFKFRESILIGETKLNKDEIDRLVKSWGDVFRGDRYHLINKNCNHFTADLARYLTGLEVPGWVNRLANVSNSIPFLERWIPQEWLTPMALAGSLPETNSRQTRERTTLNYPAPIERAQEALHACGSPSSRRKDVAPAASTGTSTSTSTSSSSGGNSWRSLLTRRSSETGATGSAPATARPGNAQAPALTRLWNSIKSLTSDEPSSPLTARVAKKTNGPIEID